MELNLECECNLICLDDFESEAKTRLQYSDYIYYATGADDQQTIQECRAAFKRYRLRPRILRDVSSRNLDTTVLGQPISFPIGISPTALQKRAHHEGELATAKAADKANTLMIVSSHSTTGVEDIATVTPNALHWMQVHIFNVRAITERLVRRAEKAGFKALVVTVDSPVLGNRMEWRRVRDYAMKRISFRFPNLETDDPEEATNVEKINKKANNLSGFNDSETWEDIRWLKGFSHIPVVVKGVLTAKAAKEAVPCGVDGIIVSAHGGRQLDCVPAPIDALSEVVYAVKDSDVEVYVDGGIRTGTDVFKALALGAKAVLLGRPILWGLACDVSWQNGENGVSQVLNIIKEEFSLTMALMGCTSLADIEPSMVVHESKYLTSSRL
ncbi:2-Hydroxyacid oxidase 1-like isoform X1 [Amphiura filiformis]|uniref:2-Hydroxyacid oxidase 1-like isoform X1 n=1 Tax=Amphiura filiformis TaxID=82378 RepID=UPI003B215967